MLTNNIWFELRRNGRKQCIRACFLHHLLKLKPIKYLKVVAEDAVLTKSSRTPAISVHNPDISAQSARRIGSQFNDRWITHPAQDQDLHELISSPLSHFPSACRCRI